MGCLSLLPILLVKGVINKPCWDSGGVKKQALPLYGSVVGSLCSRAGGMEDTVVLSGKHSLAYLLTAENPRDKEEFVCFTLVKDVNLA